MKPCLWWILAKKQLFLALDTFLKKKKPPKLLKYSLKPLLVSKKLPHKNLKPLLVSQKLPKLQFCGGNPHQNSWCNKFQNLKFWCWAIWNKFQMLKCVKKLKFLATSSLVTTGILLLDAIFLSENHEKPHFFRFVKTPSRTDENSKKFNCQKSPM